MAVSSALLIDTNHPQDQRSVLPQIAFAAAYGAAAAVRILPTKESKRAAGSACLTALKVALRETEQ